MRRGAAGADRGLGSSLRTEIQRAQGRAVEADGSGRLYRWAGGPRLEEGGESGAKSGAAQLKGRGWGVSQDTEGDGDDTKNSRNGGTGIDIRNISNGT